MPSGYTYRIEEGCSFEEFLWKCASGIDHMVSLNRDLDSEREFLEKRLGQAQQEMINVSRMTLDQAAAEIQKTNDRWKQGYDETIKKFTEVDRFYAVIQARVESWEPPSSEHENLKKFMLDQISSSRMEPPILAFIEESPTEYLERRKISAANEVDYCRRQIDRHDLSLEKSREWVRALQESVPKPPNMSEPPGR